MFGAPFGIYPFPITIDQALKAIPSATNSYLFKGKTLWRFRSDYRVGYLQRPLSGWTWRVLYGDNPSLNTFKDCSSLGPSYTVFAFIRKKLQCKTDKQLRGEQK